MGTAIALLLIAAVTIPIVLRKIEPPTTEIERWRATGLGIDAVERKATFERTARIVQ